MQLLCKQCERRYGFLENVAFVAPSSVKAMVQHPSTGQFFVYEYEKKERVLFVRIDVSLEQTSNHV